MVRRATTDTDARTSHPTEALAGRAFMKQLNEERLTWR